MSNQYMVTTLKAGEALTAVQYHAIALDDGKLANTPEEASGILLTNPASGDHMPIAYAGEIPFAAGAAVAAGAKLTVTTSGWFVTTTSLGAVVGEAKEAVTSGSIGQGIFAIFPGVTHKAEYTEYEVTPAYAMAVTGLAYCIRDNLVADNGEEAAGVLLSAISSGVAGNIGVFGKMTLRVGDTSSAGDPMRVTTSGYFIPCDSGYYQAGRILINTASGSTGAGIFYGGAAGYLPI